MLSQVEFAPYLGDLRRPYAERFLLRPPSSAAEAVTMSGLLILARVRKVRKIWRTLWPSNAEQSSTSVLRSTDAEGNGYVYT